MHWAWLLLFLSAASAGDAAPSTDPKAPVQAVGVVLSADLHSVYVRGQKILTTLVFENRGTGPIQVPDLARRPHLVRFEVTPKGGSMRVQRTSTPDSDPPMVWTLAPGGRREVLLEIPSSGALSKGSYALGITVLGMDGANYTVPAVHIDVQDARPSAGSEPYDRAVVEKVGLQAVWVQDTGTDGALYLSQSKAEDLGRIEATYFLARVPQGATPTLTRALPTQAWGRHVVWREGQRTLVAAQLGGPGRPPDVQKIDVPWPTFSTLDEGVTDERGSVHVPIWIDNPAGKPGGELRVASWRGREVPTFRSIAHFDHPIEQLTSTMDASGRLRLLILHQAFADEYSLDVTSDLPPRAVRLSDPKKAGAGTPRIARYGVLEATEGQAGGLAVLLVDDAVDATGKAISRARWIGSDGTVLRALPEQPALPAGTVVDLQPEGTDGFALLARTSTGDVLVRSGAAHASVKPGVGPALVLDAKGVVWLRSLVPGSLVQLTALPSAP